VTYATNAKPKSKAKTASTSTNKGEKFSYHAQNKQGKESNKIVHTKSNLKVFYPRMITHNNCIQNTISKTRIATKKKSTKNLQAAASPRPNIPSVTFKRKRVCSLHTVTTYTQFL
jgi:hypothetical protein